MYCPDDMGMYCLVNMGMCCPANMGMNCPVNMGMCCQARISMGGLVLFFVYAAATAENLGEKSKKENFDSCTF
jgi:hypothetical protein